MKKILLSVQNNLLSEAIQNALVKKGRFCIENVSPNQDGKILDLCIAERVDVLLMDVTRLADSTIEKRLELCGKVKEYEVEKMNDVLVELKHSDIYGDTLSAFHTRHFGKDVFLTKEEAEVALKGEQE